MTKKLISHWCITTKQMLVNISLKKRWLGNLGFSRGGGTEARPMNRYDPGGLRRRAPSSGDLAAIRAQRRLKKREGERGKVWAKRNDGTGKKKSYLRGGRLKVHSGGSIKLPYLLEPLFLPLRLSCGGAPVARRWPIGYAPATAAGRRRRPVPRGLPLLLRVDTRASAGPVAWARHPGATTTAAARAAGLTAAGAARLTAPAPPCCSRRHRRDHPLRPPCDPGP